MFSGHDDEDRVCVMDWEHCTLVDCESYATCLFRDLETERAALAEAMSQATVRVREQEEEEAIEYDWRPKL